MLGETVTLRTVTVPQVMLRKVVLDYVVTALLVILLAIPLACVAVAIKFESHGPVFFRQPRLGLNNRVFYIWKFRTMDHALADLDGERLTLRNDPRITRLGWWLRRLSIDEVPQLLNVLAGEMSIVGPRPHALKANVGGVRYDELVNDYASRHCIKPGITGWAQVNGCRGETILVEQIEMRVAYDLEYIGKQSIMFDVWIIMRTAVCLLRRIEAF